MLRYGWKATVIAAIVTNPYAMPLLKWAASTSMSATVWVLQLLSMSLPGGQLPAAMYRGYDYAKGLVGGAQNAVGNAYQAAGNAYQSAGKFFQNPLAHLKDYLGNDPDMADAIGLGNLYNVDPVKIGAMGLGAYALGGDVLGGAAVLGYGADLGGNLMGAGGNVFQKMIGLGYYDGEMQYNAKVPAEVQRLSDLLTRNLLHHLNQTPFMR